MVVIGLLTGVAETPPGGDRRVEPDIEHVRDTLVDHAVLGDGQLVDGVFVQVDRLGIDLLVGAGGEFRAVADHDRVVHRPAPVDGLALCGVCGQPDRNRCPPVSLSGGGPVGRVRDEIPEPAVAGLRGVPLAVPDVREQVVFDLCDGDKPLVGDDLDDPRVTPPAVAIRVLDGLLGQ